MADKVYKLKDTTTPDFIEAYGADKDIDMESVIADCTKIVHDSADDTGEVSSGSVLDHLLKSMGMKPTEQMLRFILAVRLLYAMELQFTENNNNESTDGMFG